MNNASLNDNKILRDFAPEVEKEEVFHTSVYATAQNGATIGAGGERMDLKKRREIDENRKYIKGYRDARLMTGLYSARKTAAVATGVRGADSSVGAAGGAGGSGGSGSSGSGASGANSGEVRLGVSERAARASDNVHSAQMEARESMRKATDAAISGASARRSAELRGKPGEKFEKLTGANKPQAVRPAPAANGGAARFQVKPNIKPSW